MVSYGRIRYQRAVGLINACPTGNVYLVPVCDNPEWDGVLELGREMKGDNRLEVRYDIVNL
ncbi:hypothetical protein EUX98_g9801 [Antrodiella citrinella]|uniref:Uncharacterized protein n=1 Tax=Antrodiella citrinella TaxID=2447956 RepID=A0A4V3XE72_9APHY|nr:hypothetical protein EUX98_g9801 [Antrodiella citrinella]